MTETLIVQKLAYILASHCEGEWFSYLFAVLRKISYKIENNGKFSIFFIPLFAQKPERKKTTSLLALNVAYWTLVQITKPWTAYLFSVLR